MLNLNAAHYVSTLLDGTKLESTRDRDEPFTIKLGQCEFLDFYLFYLNFDSCIILLGLLYFWLLSGSALN